MLLGWRQGTLRERCCSNIADGRKISDYGSAFTYFVGGTVSTAWWSAFCPRCKSSKRHHGYETYLDKYGFCAAVCELAKDWTDELLIERYPSHRFSFGEPSVVPIQATRVQKLKTSLVDIVSTRQLIEELTTQRIRSPTPRDASLVPERLTWKSAGGQVQTLKVLI